MSRSEKKTDHDLNKEKGKAPDQSSRRRRRKRQGTTNAAPSSPTPSLLTVPKVPTTASITLVPRSPSVPKTPRAATITPVPSIPNVPPVEKVQTTASVSSTPSGKSSLGLAIEANEAVEQLSQPSSLRKRDPLTTEVPRQPDPSPLPLNTSVESDEIDLEERKSSSASVIIMHDPYITNIKKEMSNESYLNKDDSRQRERKRSEISIMVNSQLDNELDEGLTRMSSFSLEFPRPPIASSSPFKMSDIDFATRDNALRRTSSETSAQPPLRDSNVIRETLVSKYKNEGISKVLPRRPIERTSLGARRQPMLSPINEQKTPMTSMEDRSTFASLKMTDTSMNESKGNASSQKNSTTLNGVTIEEKDKDEEITQGSAISLSIDSSEDSSRYLKSSIIQEYSDILETIKQQNYNLEKIKQDILSVTSPRDRNKLEYLYFAEEDKLNEELIKAMVLQSRCPYERWPEISLVANIYDDFQPAHPYYIVNNARQRLMQLEKSERQAAGEEKQTVEEQKDTKAEEAASPSNPSNELCKSPAIIASSSELDNLLKSIHKLENVNGGKFGSKQECFDELGDLSCLIVNLLKKRKKYLKHCNQCGPSAENCRNFKNICEELCWVCKLKLKQLTESDRALCCGKNEDSHCKPVAINCTDKSVQSKPLYKHYYNNTGDLPIWQKKKQTEARACKSDQGSATYSKKQKSETCCCEANQVLSLFECMAVELQKIKGDCKSSACESQNNVGMMHENQKLKEKVKELEAEKEEFKCILKEQQAQMEDYRQRYLKAKQALEEQVTKIVQLEKCNENTEEQINEEMRKIKNKFEQRGNKFPQLLEEERKKLKQCCKEKGALKEKLNIVCTELYKLKLQINKSSSNAPEDQHSEICKLKTDLLSAREMYKKIEKCNSLQKEEIKSLQSELACLRKETASILCRSKERVERQIVEAKEKIHELEDNLAKARAQACCAIKEGDKRYEQLEIAIRNCQYFRAKVKALQKHIKCLLAHQKCHRIHQRDH